MLNIGDILDGRYKILGRIGQGGMATVYKAADLKLGREVAVKMLKEEYSSDKDFIERFKNEARSAAKLSHPNIVAAYDIVNSGEMHYIVMELVEGITLRDYIARKGRLSNKETIGIALQAAEGLGEAHRNGIIHRDIKSQNIIISKEGRIKIGDFGIAKAASTDSSGQPVIGSAHYMAPEQAANGYADARSDLYSLGISMYEMITGRLPYQGDDTANVIMAHMQDALVPPSVYNSGIYPALNDIIIKATKKAPEERYASAEDLIDDLKHAAAEPDGHFVRLYDSVASGQLDGTSEAVTAQPTHDYADTQTESRVQPQADGEASYDDDEGDDGDYVVERGRGNRIRQGMLDRYDDSKIRLMITGITAGVVLLAIVIGVFILRSGNAAADAAESNLAASENTQSSEESSSDMNYTLSIEGEDVMPNLIGMTVDEARAKLASIRMSMDSSTTDYSDTYAKGTIMNQSPAQNEVLNSDSTVYVTVSLGKKTDYVLDNLKNMSEQEAVKAVEDAGMSVSDDTDKEFADDVAEGLVTGYKDDGTDSDGKRRIRLVVSYGKQEDYVKMPDITNLAVSDASDLLKSNHLSLGEIKAVNSSDAVEGDIVSQSVKADDYVKKGSSIDVELCVGDDYNISDGTIISDASDLDEILGNDNSQSTEQSSSSDRDYYYGSIDTTCVVGNVSGPGVSGSVQVAVRLVQRVDGSLEYTSLSDPIPVSAGTTIPVSYRNIKGAYGVKDGTVEVYGVDSGIVYSSYVIHFSQK